MPHKANILQLTKICVQNVTYNSRNLTFYFYYKIAMVEKGVDCDLDIIVVAQKMVSALKGREKSNELH